MTTDVMTVHADTTIEEVARLLTTRRISSVPVVGVVTDEKLFTVIRRRLQWVGH